MVLRVEISAHLHDFADQIWESSAHDDGYARFPTGSGLLSALHSFQRGMLDEVDEQWGFPWGLVEQSMLRMIWNATAGPGLGTNWHLSSLELTSGRRIYIKEDDWNDQPLLLGVSAENWSLRIDRKFLQDLFEDNGESFDIGLFGSPPNNIETSVKSFPFLVDLFVAGFDAAPGRCWEELLENWDVWHEDYENPLDPIQIPQRLLREAEVADIAAHGTPRSLMTGSGHQQRVHEAAYQMMMRDEINEFLGDVKFRERSPHEKETKLQIVARYLNLSLKGT